MRLKLTDRCRTSLAAVTRIKTVVARDAEFFFFLLSERTLLERCCVHNISPFVSSSGLSPGSREAKVQRAKVWFNCAEPSVARSSCWSLPVKRYLSDTRCKARWWSSWDELRAIWPKSRRRLLVTRWESGEQPVVLLSSVLSSQLLIRLGYLHS